jgi:hypothetical protein
VSCPGAGTNLYQESWSHWLEVFYDFYFERELNPQAVGRDGDGQQAKAHGGPREVPFEVLSGTRCTRAGLWVVGSRQYGQADPDEGEKLRKESFAQQHTEGERSAPHSTLATRLFLL